MRIIFLSWIFTFFQIIPPEAIHPVEPIIFRFNYENVLGTSFELKVLANSEQTADYAEEIALAEIDRLNNILSTYNSSSEVSHWQKTIGVETKLSPELFEVLTLFDNWKQKTSGALTASIGTASAVWKTAEKKQQIPGKEDLAKAVLVMQQPQWKLNNKTKTAIHLSNQPLVLNSFVKSYIIRKVAGKIMDIPGVEGAVVNIGGDMVIAGTQTETVHIADPIADTENGHPVSIIQLHERAIATSGNYRRGYKIGNQWFSHIIDPRTANPVTQIISATVVAPNATDAGALATAFNVLQPQESIALAATIPGVDFQMITADGIEIVSDGWKSLEISGNEKSPLLIPSQGKLTIELELASFEGRYRRPFVAVWIENAKRESVRTLELWYNKPRWLPDLKRWYANNQSIIQDSVAKASISSATRSAGKYTLSWDGLDASKKTLPNGTYTLYIEAAREHGTYQLIKQEFEWNGKPKHFDLEGGIEIKSASLDISK